MLCVLVKQQSCGSVLTFMNFVNQLVQNFGFFPNLSYQFEKRILKSSKEDYEFECFTF